MRCDLSIKVRTVGPYVDVVFEIDNASVNISMLEKSDCFEIAKILRSAADDLDGLETEDYEALVKKLYMEGYEDGCSHVESGFHYETQEVVELWFETNHKDGKTA